MGRETSILVTLKENYTSGIGKMLDSNKQYQDSMKSISGVMEQLETRHDSLVEQLTATKTALIGAKDSAKDAKSAYDKLASPETEERMNAANQVVTQMTSDMRAYESAIKSTDKELASLYDMARKQETSAVSKAIGSGTSGDDGSDLLSTLSAMGLTKLAGNLASNAASTYISSAFGDRTASGIESLLSGIVDGASLGLASGTGVVGVAVGTAIGGVVGTFNALLGEYSNKDEAFNSLLNQNYSNVVDGSAELMDSGMSIAGSREQYRIAFSNLLGSQEAADAYLEDVRQMAIDTTYGYDEIVGYTKLLLNSFQPDEILDVLMDLSDASAGIGLESSDVQMFIQGFQNMKLEDKVTAQYIQYFTRRGLDANKALAEFLNVNKSEIPSMITKGEISGEDGVKAILEFIQREYGGMSKDLAMTYDGIVDNLEDAEADLENSMASSFQNARKDSLIAVTNSYDGEAGALKQEAAAKYGAADADLLNEQDRIKLEFEDAVLFGTIVEGYTEGVAERLHELSIEFANGLESTNPEDQRKAWLALQEAYEMAANEFIVSDAYQMQQEAFVDLAENLAADDSLSDAYYTTGLTLAEALSRGLAAGIDAERGRIAERIASGLYVWNSSTLSYESPYSSSSKSTSSTPKSHAVGLGYVPYNNYPALLHEGERVLTASEARAADGAGAAPVQIIINVPVTDAGNAALAEQVAQVIATKVTDALSTIIK